jgi:hypothetical protein
MATKLLTETYAEAMDGMLACYDRLILTGSLHPFSYAQGIVFLSMRKRVI